MLRQCCSRGIVFSLLCLFLFGTAQSRTHRVEAVKGIDMNQFSGTWYEIARLPNKHEKGLVEVTSTFRKTRDGDYEVINRGYKGSRGGKCTTVKGKVVIPDKKKNGAMKLKIFWYSIDYKIIDIDKKNYQYVVISGDSNKYLWIFSKSPIMDQGTYESITEKVQQKGYEVSQLEMVSQVHNSAVAGM